jgi:phage shock protein E
VAGIGKAVRRVRMEQVLTIVVVAIAVALVVKRFSGRSSREDIGAALRTDAVLVVDVRSPGEYATGHIEGALNIPVQELGRRLDEFGAKGRMIVLYCHSGMRAASAQSMLKRAGFSRVVNARTMHGVEAAR